MIRLCDKNVYNAYLSENNFEKCMEFFLDNHKKDIICFYNNDKELYGTLNYVDLLKKNNLQEAICTKNKI
ncbi:MAG: hypothetical protein K5986_03230 [Clostridium sp.]|nr:hypothetical protein [Clostridium sp.]